MSFNDNKGMIFVCVNLHLCSHNFNNNMIKPLDFIPAETLSEFIIHGIQEKKGKDLVKLDINHLKEAVTKMFFICHADSTTQVRAIAGAVEEEVKKAAGVRPWRIEGYEHAQWILLDYVDVVVHVFLKDLRGFYGLEELWNDAVKTEYNF